MNENINSNKSQFGILMGVFIMLVGIGLIIGGFFYYILNRTIKIDSKVVEIDNTALTAKIDYVLNSQSYTIIIDSEKLNINDQISLWVRSNNPNVVFTDSQSSEKNGIIAIIVGIVIVLCVLLYYLLKKPQLPSPPPDNVLSPKRLIDQKILKIADAPRNTVTSWATPVTSNNNLF